MIERVSPAPRHEPQIKGTAIVGALRAVDRICPPGTRKKMLAILPDQIVPAVEHDSFLVAGWYPLAHLRSIFVAAMKATGRDLALVRELSREATKEDFRGIYRLLTFVLSPEFIMRRGPSVFQRYYDTGSLSVEARHGYAEARYRGCVGFDHILWEDVNAGASAVLEACGAKNVRVRAARGGGDGDEELDLVCEWS